MAKWAERAPVLAGLLLRRLGRGVPGVAGAVLVAAGFGLAWLPLGLIAAGAFLLLLDWRIPAEGANAPATERVDFGDGRRRLRAVA